MLFNVRKFRKEIAILPQILNQTKALQPLRQEQIKERVMASMSSPSVKDLPVSRGEKLVRYIVSVLIGLSLVGGSAFASGTSMPGDALYPIKKIKEKIQLYTAGSAEARANLEARFAGERLNELIKVEASAQTEASAKAEAKTKAKQEASVQVQNAINVLTDVKAKQEAKGNTDAAAAIEANITKLQEKAQEQHLEVNTEADATVEVKTDVVDVKTNVDAEVKGLLEIK